jgi:hypothetical protein
MAQNNIFPPHAMPLVGSVTAKDAFDVEITWAAGSRAGRTEVLDLSPIINAVKFFRPLRNDRSLFETVHSIAFGNAIAWGEDEAVDLSATALQRLAEETMRPDDLRQFISDQGLSETALAAILDYSRRQIVSFVNHERPIPRVVSLACRYIELKNPISQSTPAPDVRIVPLIADPLSPNTTSATGVEHQTLDRLANTGIPKS